MKDSHCSSEAAIRYNFKHIMVAKFKLDNTKFGEIFEAEDLLYNTRGGARDRVVNF